MFDRKNCHKIRIRDIFLTVINFEKMTFIFIKTVTIDISLTLKKCHNKQICDIFFNYR